MCALLFPKLTRFDCCYYVIRTLISFPSLKQIYHSHISDDEIGIQGYTIYRLDRQAQSKGGVGVYVRDFVSVLRRFDLESNSIEGIWLEILIAKS